MTTPSSPHRSSRNIAGLLLIGSSWLSLLLLIYHPLPRAKTYQELVDTFASQQLVNAIVHGGLIGLSWIMLVAMTYLVDVLRASRLLVRIALASFILGTLAMTSAAMISGFIVPDLVAKYAREVEKAASQPHQPSLEEHRRHLQQLTQLVHVVNQTCSRAGVLATALAILLWSLAMLHGTWAHVGWLGTFAGLTLIVTLLLSYLPMNVHGMLAYVGVLTLWNSAVGWLLWRMRVAE
jgi:hypothetical protein